MSELAATQPAIGGDGRLDRLQCGQSRATAGVGVGAEAGGGDQHQALDALGKGDRELGGDEAAHRVADERGGVDAELVEQASSMRA